MTNSLSQEAPLKAKRAHHLSRVALHGLRAAAVIALASLTLPLEGCAVAALPCRLVSATVKIVPVVGHPAAVPFDACAAAID
ncbi:conserved hypothetical protein [Paraburkholderia tropica]|uniref:DUF6726 family protein n=1 Tax=Paraburkholderia TaxID=1822464 RepID=UPI001CAF7426|nr:DUF6726 family protein [Paraburkholderia tropica]CAG9207018.1 conserved hypothetical protein [Paraburkholderia tropica]